MPGLVSATRQFFPGKLPEKAKDVPDMTGKVMIVTGSNTGLGKEIAQILYSRNAKVYMMARSEEKTLKAIENIKAAEPKSKGSMTFIRLDLGDLTTVRASADEFLRKEQKLDVLFNNAGVGLPEKGSKTTQGYELQLGVNCLGSFALTKCLTPALVETAKVAPPNSVRIVWVSSSACEGVEVTNYVEKLSQLENKSSMEQYNVSKLGNYLHATEFAARHKKDGVISIPLNPGALDSDFWREQGSITTWLLRRTLLFPPVYGAYTTLFAGFSPEVTLEKSGSFVAPWGRFWDVSKDMIAASKSMEEGGTGIAKQFWDWTEEQIKPYL